MCFKATGLESDINWVKGLWYSSTVRSLSHNRHE
jgi:hypothetical protein